MKHSVALVTAIKALVKPLFLVFILLAVTKTSAVAPNSVEESYISIHEHIRQIRSTTNLHDFFALIKTFQYGDRPMLYEGLSDTYERQLIRLVPPAPANLPIDYEVVLNFDDIIRRNLRIFWYVDESIKEEHPLIPFYIKSLVKNQNVEEISRNCAPDIITGKYSCLIHSSVGKDSYNMLEIQQKNKDKKVYVNLSRSKVSLLRTIMGLVFQGDQLFFEKNRNYEDIKSYEVKGIFNVEAISFQYRMEKKIYFSNMSDLTEKLKAVKLVCTGECTQNVKIYVQIRFATKDNSTVWYSSDRWIIENNNFF